MNASDLKKTYTTAQSVGLAAGPSLCVLVLLLLPVGQGEGALTAEARATLAATLWVALWWMTEPIPIPATSLLPVVLFPLTGAQPVGPTATGYFQPMIFLFLGGFLIAAAMQRWNLHRRIALEIVLRVGASRRAIVLGFMLATAFLSAWISNTATAMMMMPIGVAVALQASDGPQTKLGKALTLGIAYSASIGGVATLVGTPTNGIFAKNAETFLGREVAFADWALLGGPVALVLTVACWCYLTRYAFPLPTLGPSTTERRVIESELRKLGPQREEEEWTLLVFLTVAAGWAFKKPLLALMSLDVPIHDAIIGLAGALALFAIPSNRGGRVLDWATARNIPWGVLLLFGGGLSMAGAFQSSGLAQWLGAQMEALGFLPYFLLLLCVVAIVNLMTEISSNVATASVMMPVLASLGPAIGVEPYGLMAAAAISASCAFMLPVSTAANAIAYAQGYVSMRDMNRAGLWLNLLSVLFVTLYFYWVAPLVW